jgi:uncharacterized membrane protein YcaP (DUF421 family)
VLVANGEVRRRELRKCGLTDNDLFAHLREQGVFSLADLRYVLYEAKGALTVVPYGVPRTRDELIDAGLEGAVDYAGSARDG